MKKVIQIMDYAAPYRGNFIPSILNLSKHLDKAGIGVVYVFPETAQKIQWVMDFQKERGCVYFIKRSFFSKKIRYSNIKRLKEIIVKEEVRIIHTHFLAYNYTLALLKIFFTRGIKIIGNFMNEYQPPHNIYYKFKVFITGITFDKIVASSEGVKRSILDAGIKGEKVVTIFNSLDLDHLQTYEPLNLKTETNQKIILMFGWTFYRKGVDIAIRAMKELVEEGMDLRLVIAMAGGQEIIENEIIKMTNVIPGWITLKGPVQNVATYYNAADIFLSSSREEGFTYSVLEAAYCNPLIIMSKIDGHPLGIPYSGIFENGNVAGLKETIVRMLGTPADEINIIKEAQKEYVAKTYDIDKWSEAILNEYSYYLA